MRICLYTETALPKIGGQELVVDALARQYQYLGHEVMVLAPYPRAPWEPNDLALPYPVTRHWRFWSTRRMLGVYRYWLLRLQKRFPFDVLHCHNVYPCGYLASLCRGQWAVPTVITSHGDVGETFRLLQKPGIRQRYQQAIRSAAALIAISRFTLEGYRRLVPDVQNVVPLPNGVHLDTFATQHDPPLGLDADIKPGRYLLFLGRLSRRKGVDVLLEAMARMGDSGRGYPLVVAGHGDERAALEQQAARLQLGPRVRFVGAVGGAGKSWLLQNAALLCLPSRDWEAFPLVVLEGYAAGCPIVASRIPGLMDLVAPGETGWLVEPESPGNLAATVTEALGNPSHLQALRATARQRAQQYDWSAVAGRHIELFQRLIAGTAARQAA